MSWNDIRQLSARWAYEVCRLPAYWRLRGRPVCSVLNLTDFVAHYGFLNFFLILRVLRQTIAEKVGVNPFLIGVMSRTDAPNVQLARGLPIDGATGYALLPDWMGPTVQEYEELIGRRINEWQYVQQRLRIPFFPVVSAGWDATVRGERLPQIEPTTGFPWAPVVTGVTRERFGYFLDEAVAFNQQHHPEQNIVFIHAWNEWTESSVVEPSDRFGTDLLQEIEKRAHNVQFDHL